MTEVARWGKVAREVARSMARRSPSALSHEDDLYQEAFRAILEARGTWNLKRGPFIPYASAAARFAVQRYVWRNTLPVVAQALPAAVLSQLEGLPLSEDLIWPGDTEEVLLIEDWRWHVRERFDDLLSNAERAMLLDGSRALKDFQEVGRSTGGQYRSKKRAYNKLADVRSRMFGDRTLGQLWRDR